MKLLYCYDGPIMIDDRNEYYCVNINNEMPRYEVISNDITIAIRVRKIKEDISRFSKIDKQKYKIISCPNLSSLKGIFLNRKKCRKILEEQVKEADCLVIRLPSMIGNLSVKIAKKYNKPYLVELVGCPWDALWNHSMKGKMFAPIMTIATKINVKNAPYVVYVTSEFLQKRYPTNGKNIGCSDVILKKIDESILDNRKNKIIKETKPLKLATIAAIDVKYKGQKYVIKAMANLKKKGYMFEYYLIGGGNNEYLSKLAQKYNLESEVKFVGPIAHDEIFESIDKIDIYIQPSKQEGLPRALVEAMSRACPCIGSNAGGIPELLESKYIFKKGNVKELIKILQDYTKDDMLIQSTKNFEVAKGYKKNVLEEKRKDFYKKFYKDLL